MQSWAQTLDRGKSPDSDTLPSTETTSETADANVQPEESSSGRLPLSSDSSTLAPPEESTADPLPPQWVSYISQKAPNVLRSLRREYPLPEPLPNRPADPNDFLQSPGPIPQQELSSELQPEILTKQSEEEEGPQRSTKRKAHPHIAPPVLENEPPQAREKKALKRSSSRPPKAFRLLKAKSTESPQTSGSTQDKLSQRLSRSEPSTLPIKTDTAPTVDASTKTLDTSASLISTPLGYPDSIGTSQQTQKPDLLLREKRQPAAKPTPKAPLNPLASVPQTEEQSPTKPTCEDTLKSSPGSLDLPLPQKGQPAAKPTLKALLNPLASVPQTEEQSPTKPTCEDTLKSSPGSIQATASYRSDARNADSADPLTENSSPVRKKTSHEPIVSDPPRSNEPHTLNNPSLISASLPKPNAATAHKRPNLDHPKSQSQPPHIHSKTQPPQSGKEGSRQLEADVSTPEARLIPKKKPNTAFNEVIATENRPIKTQMVADAHRTKTAAAKPLQPEKTSLNLPERLPPTQKHTSPPPPFSFELDTINPSHQPQAPYHHPSGTRKTATNKAFIKSNIIDHQYTSTIVADTSPTSSGNPKTRDYGNPIHLDERKPPTPELLESYWPELPDLPEIDRIEEGHLSEIQHLNRINHEQQGLLWNV